VVWRYSLLVEEELAQGVVVDHHREAAVDRHPRLLPAVEHLLVAISLVPERRRSRPSAIRARFWTARRAPTGKRRAVSRSRRGSR